MNTACCVNISVYVTASSDVCYTPYIGCQVIAPSDMMDNRVAAIKQALKDEGLGGKVRARVLKCQLRERQWFILLYTHTGGCAQLQCKVCLELLWPFQVQCMCRCNIHS